MTQCTSCNELVLVYVGLLGVFVCVCGSSLRDSFFKHNKLLVAGCLLLYLCMCLFVFSSNRSMDHLLDFCKNHS